MLEMDSCQRLNLRGLVFHEHSTTGSHFPSFFSFFYLKVYLNMSRLSTMCVKLHPTGDKNRVCESLSTSGRVWHHKNSIIYAPPKRIVWTFDPHHGKPPYCLSLGCIFKV